MFGLEISSVKYFKFLKHKLDIELLIHLHDVTGLSGYDATLNEIILKMLMLFNKNSVDIFYFSLINDGLEQYILSL